MNLQSILSDYHDRFLARYGNQLNTDQWSALNALSGCRQGQYGELFTELRTLPAKNNYAALLRPSRLQSMPASKYTTMAGSAATQAVAGQLLHDHVYLAL